MRTYLRVVVAVIAAAVVVMCAGQAGAAPADEPSPARNLHALIELSLQRIDTGDAVAAAKWGTSSPIDDPAREAQVYESMVTLAGSKGLPADWIRSVFMGQIEANKVVQRGLHTRWRFDPASAPSARPDLTAVRPVIDRVNKEIVDQLVAHRDLLTGPDCAVNLSQGVFAAVTSGRADALHSAALVRAAVTLCSPR